MNKYHNGKTYKIIDNSYTKQYIGSTTEKLSQRMTRHRSDYRRHLDGRRLYKISVFDLFDEFGIENCKIELIEYCKCDSKDELIRREGEIIKNSDCVNKQIAGRTQKEYQQDNYEQLAEQKREYGQREYVCELCNITLRVADKSKHEATDKHIKLVDLQTEEISALKEKNDKLKERKAKYYARKRETILQNERERYERKKERMKCDCGCEVYKHNLTHHCKSNKHQKYLKSLEPLD